MNATRRYSVPIYQEPRFKRELDVDPEDVLTLLSLWENQRYRKRNWRKNVYEEYDNAAAADDDDEEEENLPQEGENPRNVISWMDSPMYLPRSQGVPANIGILRTHPFGHYYDRYDDDANDNDDEDDDEDEDEDEDEDDDEEEAENDHRYGQQRYEASRHADGARYGLVHPYQRTYYETTPAKRWTLRRKRSVQIYDPYAGGATQSQANPRSRGHLYHQRSFY